MREGDAMHRGRFRRRVTAVVGVLGLLGALLVALTAAPAAATPIPPSTSSCTYNGSPNVVPNATAGMAVTVACTGLPATTAVALVETSGLAGVASPSNAAGGFADTSHVVLGTTDATGAVTLAGVVRTTAPAAPNNFVPANADPNAVCPPTQAEINAGLVGCAFAVANVATMTGLNTAVITFSGQGTPAAPTLALSPSSNVFSGNTLTASDAAATGFWWGASITGSPNAAAGVPGLTATVGGVTATNTLSTTPAAYCTGVAPAVGVTPSPLCTGVTPPAGSGTTVPPALHGSITVPSPPTPPGPFPAGSTQPVVVTQPNTTPVAGTIS